MDKEFYYNICNGVIKVAVIGLGYVGLPIAVAFSKKAKTIGFDISREKILQYLRGQDPTKEVGSEEIRNSSVEFTCSEEKLKEAGFLVITVPTPVNADKTPDLTPVTRACEIVGRNLSKDSIVVFESTVYPGVTEEVCIPILEKESGLICGRDFKVGYSPERINPGDKIHRLNNIVKIVSGIDEEARNIIASVYELIIDAGVYKAGSIKVAEAAKLVENAQRDINIAFMNELAMVFEKMNIHTKEVIDAMNTKWNALGFTPGLVGGHCIGVDPYYFIYQAECLGYHSQIILSGRKINNDMGFFIGDIVIKKLVMANKLVKTANIYVMGITFKENCPDIRNSKVEDIIKRLQEYNADVKIADPVADEEEVRRAYQIELIKPEEVRDADCIIFAVAHSEFKKISLKQLKTMYKDETGGNKILIDVKNIFDKEELENAGYTYWSL